MNYLVSETRVKNDNKEYTLQEVAIFEQANAAISFIKRNIKYFHKMKYPSRMILKDLRDGSVFFESECYFGDCKIVQ